MLATNTIPRGVTARCSSSQASMRSKGIENASCGSAAMTSCLKSETSAGETA
jgi:hypothetical protein